MTKLTNVKTPSRSGMGISSVIPILINPKEKYKICYVDGKYWIMPASANPKKFVENYKKESRRCSDGKTSNT